MTDSAARTVHIPLLPRGTRRTSVGFVDLYQSIDSIIDDIQGLKAEAEARGQTNVRVDTDECSSLDIWADRPETDEELRQRSVRMNLRANADKQRRQAEYEKLKREFG